MHVRLDAPWLYPPRAHPYWDGLDPAAAQERQTLFSIAWDSGAVRVRSARSADPVGFAPAVAGPGAGGTRVALRRVGEPGRARPMSIQATGGARTSLAPLWAALAACALLLAWIANGAAVLRGRQDGRLAPLRIPCRRVPEGPREHLRRSGARAPEAARPVRPGAERPLAPVGRQPLPREVLPLFRADARPPHAAVAGRDRPPPARRGSPWRSSPRAAWPRWRC